MSDDKKKSRPKSPADSEPTPKRKPPLFTTSLAAAATDAANKPSLIDQIDSKRLEQYESIAAFKFNKARVRVLSECKEIPEDSRGVLYWMSRDQRVQDNWALLYAQKLALKQNLPLYVCFCMAKSYPHATYRAYNFLIEGLKEIKQELDKLNIPFYVFFGEPKEQVTNLVKANRIGGVICDFSPTRISLKWLDELKRSLPDDTPFAQVDAHNVVPCWHASDHLEVGARTIRTKINSKLSEFLTEFPPLVAQKSPSDLIVSDCSHLANIDDAYSQIDCDRNVRPVTWALPGYKAGVRMLQSFIEQRLKVYDTDRNDPNKNAQSGLSPWFKFGHLSVQRACLEVKKYSSKHGDAVKSFLEEAIVRRELADNYCYYQKNYDNIEGAAGWAKETLRKHSKDKRPAIYTLEQLENGKTGDALWNAAQIQLRVDGKMHGFLRMYWAKKILEWTESPEQAIEYSILLNDKYSLDGRDPNGYVGCMWSVCGVHDQGWGEREVFGKIRYMNYAGCKRKFEVSRFEQKYGAKRNLL